jgi:hypothetical protein
VSAVIAKAVLTDCPVLAELVETSFLEPKLQQYFLIKHLLPKAALRTKSQRVMVNHKADAQVFMVVILEE